MNIFTKFLAQRSKNGKLQTLIKSWDQLEILVITVFKSKHATAEDEETYRTIRAQMHEIYPHWEAELQPLWKRSRVGHEPATADPFHRVCRAKTAADFIGDWEAMQNLATAREALNWLVMKHGKTT